MIITYDFYENQNQGLLPFQDSINFRIVDFVRSNTEFEIDYDPNKKLSTDFFLNQLTYFDSLSRSENQNFSSVLQRDAWIQWLITIPQSR